MSTSKTALDSIIESLPWYTLYYYALVAVTGGAGGCALASTLRARGIKIDVWIFLSYITIGSFSAVMFVAFLIMKGWIDLTIESAIVYGGLGCLFTVGVISGVNVTLHFSSRRFAKNISKVPGLEITVDNNDSGPK